MSIDPQNQWLKGAVWALGLSLGGFIMLGATFYSNDRNAVLERMELLEQQMAHKRVRVNELLQSVARISEHSDEHDRTSVYWKKLIESNQSRIIDLSTNASSRPDPFTGNQGRELERRIDQLERCCDRLGRGNE